MRRFAGVHHWLTASAQEKILEQNTARPRGRGFRRSRGEGKGFRRPEAERHETHLSAQQTGSQTPSWLPFAHGDPRWSSRYRQAPCARPEEAERIIRQNAPSAKDGAPTVEVIKKRRDFLAARNGVRQHSQAFVLQLVRNLNNEADTVRFGITVTKRIGNAVVRNRIKRRLRAAIAHISSELPAEFQGVDVVIIARTEALTQTFDALASDLLDGVGKGLDRLVAKNRVKGQ